LLLQQLVEIRTYQIAIQHRLIAIRAMRGTACPATVWPGMTMPVGMLPHLCAMAEGNAWAMREPLARSSFFVLNPVIDR